MKNNYKISMALTVNKEYNMVAENATDAMERIIDIFTSSDIIKVENSEVDTISISAIEAETRELETEFYYRNGETFVDAEEQFGAFPDYVDGSEEYIDEEIDGEYVTEPIPEQLPGQMPETDSEAGSETESGHISEQLPEPESDSD